MKYVYIVEYQSIFKGFWTTRDIDVFSNKKRALDRMKNCIEVNKGFDVEPSPYWVFLSNVVECVVYSMNSKDQIIGDDNEPNKVFKSRIVITKKEVM